MPLYPLYSLVVYLVTMLPTSLSFVNFVAFALRTQPCTNSRPPTHQLQYKPPDLNVFQGQLDQQGSAVE